jgi:hypothetical protein
MERLSAKWPHTLGLAFEPEGELISSAADLRRIKQAVDPVEICELFVEYTSGGPADAGHLRVLRDVVEAVRNSEAGADLAAGGLVSTTSDSPPDLAGPAIPAEARSVEEWLANASATGDWLDAELAHPDRDADAGDREKRRGGSSGGNTAAA